MRVLGCWAGGGGHRWSYVKRHRGVFNMILSSVLILIGETESPGGCQLLSLFAVPS